MAAIEEVITTTDQEVPTDDKQFSYIDISSIDRVGKRIARPQALAGRDAPSRARRVVRAGDVLVSMTRPNLNAVALVPEQYDKQIASTGFAVLRASGVDPRWLYYVVRTETFVAAMSHLAQGALYPAIRSRDVRAFRIPVAPLNEQRRIADKVDTLLAKVDTCRKRLDWLPPFLERFRQAILAAATSGTLTEDWRAGQGCPAAWTIVSLKTVASDFSYGSSAKSSTEGLVPVLRMGNIRGGVLDWGDLVYTSEAAEIAKYRLSDGDVLFNRTNSPELVGKTAVFRGEREAIYAGYLIRVRCKESLLPEYLNYCLNSPAGREYCRRVKSDSVGQSNINAKKLATFSFLLPSVQEQQEIVRRVDALFSYADRLETGYDTARAHIELWFLRSCARLFAANWCPRIRTMNRRAHCCNASARRAQLPALAVGA